MAEKLIVLGAGPGGYVAALRAAALGGEVTLIEKGNLGGTCLNLGCIPSKIMKNSADVFLKFLNAQQFGIDVQGTITPDITALMKKKEKIIKIQQQGIAALLKRSKVSLKTGRAIIKSLNTVELISHDTDPELLEYDRLIIATGAQPLDIPEFPFDHKYIISSDDIVNLDNIPESIVIVGGGVIGCEFACILSALGSKVTVVEAMSRLLPLPSVDEDCSKLLLREMKKRKISVFCDTLVTSCKVKDGQVTVNLGLSPFTDNPNPKPLKNNIIQAETMAVCIGRVPLSSGLGLETIGIDTDSKGWIKVDERLETSVKGIYAVGDILGPQKTMLAHVASHEGMVAACNAMGQDNVMDYNVIPGGIFTMPEIGTVGLSEAQALKKGYDVQSFNVDFRVLGKAHAVDEIAGTAKMIVEKESKKVLGVHLIGAHATDLIAEAALAVRKGLSADDIAHTIHAHPTFAEIMGELSLKAAGMPIHG